MSGYCKHCDTLTNAIVQVYEGKMLVWVGCSSCYEKRKEVIQNLRRQRDNTKSTRAWLLLETKRGDTKE